MALQEVVAAIFKIFQTKYMLSIVVQVEWRGWALGPPFFKFLKPNICWPLLCRWRGVARGSGSHLLHFPNQIYAEHCCAGGVALQELLAAIF